MRYAIGIAIICGMVFGSTMFVLKEIRASKPYQCTKLKVMT